MSSPSVTPRPGRQRCQLHSRLSQPSALAWLRLALAALRDRLRLRTRLRGWLAERRRRGMPATVAAGAGFLGAPSRFAAGDWVRVRDPEQVFASLDTHKTLRGLVWGWQQWPSCGTVHRVLKPVRRMMDDAYRVRPISATVVLDTVPCSGPQGQHGCGRDCPMMYRDEWLEAAPPPLAADEAGSDHESEHGGEHVHGYAGPHRSFGHDQPYRPDGHDVDNGYTYATVRSVAGIAATLDAAHERDGLLFMPEMNAYAGRRFRIRRRVDWVLDGGVRVPVTAPIVMLEGLFCGGEILAADGPCDRACRLLWHEDWLLMETAAAGNRPAGEGNATDLPRRKT
ncbi:MAG TPA: hypothetical protein VFY24_00355 [Azospira sp.]|nr:hypothetical protein [Azospira sp.]